MLLIFQKKTFSKFEKRLGTHFQSLSRVFWKYALTCYTLKIYSTKYGGSHDHVTDFKVEKII